MVVLGKGLQVARVDQSSPAYAAGLRSGDKVTYLNGKKLTSLSEAAKALSATAPTAKQVHVVADRDGDARSILWKIGQPGE